MIRSLISSLRLWLRAQRQRRQVRQWERAGRPAPPPHLVKQNVLREHAQQFGCRTLVETGTFFGDMVEAMRPHFDQIYSIELSPDLYTKACGRFSGVSGVTLIQGDSGQQLASLVPQLTNPTLFWLDGHWSAGPTAKGEKETPIVEELGHILQNPNAGHVIIIDDAREFGSAPDFPTLDELKTLVGRYTDGYEIAVDTDSIRLVPSAALLSEQHAA